MPAAKLQYLNMQNFFILYFKLKIIINVIYYFKLKMIINVIYLNVCIVSTLFLLAFCSDKWLMAQYIYILGTPCFHTNTGSIMSSISGDWAFSRFTSNCNSKSIELVWNVRRICIYLCGGPWNLSTYFQVMKCNVFTKLFLFVCACACVCARARVRECAFVRVYVVDLFLNRWFSVIKMHYDMLMKPKRICFLFSTMIYD